MKRKAVLLDSSFFMRFLNDNDPLYGNADSYYRYFLENNIAIVISTISIAEYCVRGNINELPWKDLQILPFNIQHAKRTGEFAKVVFDNKVDLKLKERTIIPNDSKLFAQADSELNIEFYLSSDTESVKIYKLLKDSLALKFTFIDLHIPPSETFGILDFNN